MLFRRHSFVLCMLKHVDKLIKVCLSLDSLLLDELSSHFFGVTIKIYSDPYWLLVVTKCYINEH